MVMFWTSVFAPDRDDVNSASSGALCGVLACSCCVLQPHSAAGKDVQSQCTQSDQHNIKAGKLLLVFLWFLMFLWISFNFNWPFSFC